MRKDLDAELAQRRERGVEVLARPGARAPARARLRPSRLRRSTQPPSPASGAVQPALELLLGVRGACSCRRSRTPTRQCRSPSAVSCPRLVAVPMAATAMLRAHRRGHPRGRHSRRARRRRRRSRAPAGGEQAVAGLGEAPLARRPPGPAPRVPCPSRDGPARGARRRRRRGSTARRHREQVLGQLEAALADREVGPVVGGRASLAVSPTRRISSAARSSRSCASGQRPSWSARIARLMRQRDIISRSPAFS